EDIQVCAQRRALVHILRVHACPEKSLPRYALQSGEINLARCQKINILLGEIIAYDANQLDFGEVRSSKRNVSSGPAQHTVDFAVGSFNTVVCDGTYYDEGHGRIDCSRGGLSAEVTPPSSSGIYRYWC